MKKNWKNRLVVTMFALASLNGFAQNNDETETLMSGSFNFEDIGFSVTPGVGFTQMDGAFASLLTLRAGVSFSDRIKVGGFYNMSLNQIMPKSETVPNVYMDYQAAGGFFEYTIFSNKLMHLTFPLFIGAGEVQMDNEAGAAGLGEQSFFLVEPTAFLELNVHKYVRLNLGTGYRFVNDMTYRNFNQDALSGFSGYVGLKIGLFK